MNQLWLLMCAIVAAVLFLIFNTTGANFFGVDNDRLAGVLFLTILGAAIIAGSSPRFSQWRTYLRDGLAWILIILVLMVGYTYRYELQDIGSRLTAGLIPGSPISTVSVEGKQQVTLIRGEGGHFRAKAKLANETIDFLVDTGASVIVLSHKDALKANVEIDALNYNAIVSTANGETFTARYRFNEIDLGGIKRNNIRALIAQEGDLDTSLLGMSFLGSLNGFEIKGDRLILTD
ncbi:MAG: TIGR02281 family clan AA aspartic protease [Nitratireductor sp.]